MTGSIPAFDRPRIGLAVLAITLLSACGTSDTGAGFAPEHGDGIHGISTDPAAATSFITSNASPPETAVEKNGVMRDADGRPYTYDLLDKPLPAFSGTLLDGEVFTSSAIDQWTVINVWGVWCGDSRADGHNISDLAARLAETDDVAFLSIHTPSSAERADDAFGPYGSVDAYFEDRGFGYRTLIDPDATIREALAITWTPSYLLVSPDGIVRGFRTDLSVAQDADPVAAFLADIEEVRGRH